MGSSDGDAAGGGAGSEQVDAAGGQAQAVCAGAQGLSGDGLPQYREKFHLRGARQIDVDIAVAHHHLGLRIGVDDLGQGLGRIGYMLPRRRRPESRQSDAQCHHNRYDETFEHNYLIRLPGSPGV